MNTVADRQHALLQVPTGPEIENDTPDLVRYGRHYGKYGKCGKKYGYGYGPSKG